MKSRRIVIEAIEDQRGIVLVEAETGDEYLCKGKALPVGSISPTGKLKKIQMKPAKWGPNPDYKKPPRKKKAKKEDNKSGAKGKVHNIASDTDTSTMNELHNPVGESTGDAMIDELISIGNRRHIDTDPKYLRAMGRYELEHALRDGDLSEEEGLLAMEGRIDGVAGLRQDVMAITRLHDNKALRHANRVIAFADAFRAIQQSKPPEKFFEEHGPQIHSLSESEIRKKLGRFSNNRVTERENVLGLTLNGTTYACTHNSFIAFRAEGVADGVIARDKNIPVGTPPGLSWSEVSGGEVADEDRTTFNVSDLLHAIAAAQAANPREPKVVLSHIDGVPKLVGGDGTIGDWTTPPITGKGSPSRMPELLHTPIKINAKQLKDALIGLEKNETIAIAPGVNNQKGMVHFLRSDGERHTSMKYQGATMPIDPDGKLPNANIRELRRRVNAYQAERSELKSKIKDTEVILAHPKNPKTVTAPSYKNIAITPNQNGKGYCFSAVDSGLKMGDAGTNMDQAKRLMVTIGDSGKMLSNTTNEYWSGAAMSVARGPLMAQLAEMMTWASNVSRGSRYHSEYEPPKKNDQKPTADKQPSSPRSTSKKRAKKQ